jgi:hypothetical protein
MKRNFMNSKRLTARLSKSQELKKNIHEQIEETISVRKIVLPQWEKLFLTENIKVEKDIHILLKETIAEFKQSMQQHEQFFTANKNRKAA